MNLHLEDQSLVLTWVPHRLDDPPYPLGGRGHLALIRGPLRTRRSIKPGLTALAITNPHTTQFFTTLAKKTHGE